LKLLLGGERNKEINSRNLLRDNVLGT
jgi:hypothetical protein